MTTDELPPSVKQHLEAIGRNAPGRRLLEAPAKDALTYGHAAEFLSEIQELIRRHGLGAQARIAIAVTDSAESVTCFLAVANCAIACPVNPHDTLASYREYFRDLKPDVLITCTDANADAAAAAQDLAIPVWQLHRLRDTAAGIFSLLCPEAAPHPTRSSTDDIALILHTSGSTGRPKRAPHRMSQMWQTARNTAQKLELGATDKNLVVTPMFHSHGLVSNVLLPLVTGGTIAFPGLFSADTWDAWMDMFQPTWYSVGPTIHRDIIRNLEARDAWQPYPSLRFVRSGSAPLEASFIEKLQRRLGVPVIEAYGMSEAPHISCNPLSAPRVGSVGISTGPEIGILDDDGQSLPTGALGEIAVRGPTVIQGYDHETQDPQRNAVNWFRTGDLGRLDLDGYLYIEGRLKEIINRGGEKIMPLEIDRTLCSHHAVANALAFSIPHPTLGEDIAAVVILRSDCDATESELREYVMDKLGFLKTPVRILFPASIPCGPTGKPLRSQLWNALADELATPYVAPNTTLEHAVCQQFMELLGAAKVGLDDNFFMLGGDSLCAQRVAARISQQYPIELHAMDIFRNPTPGQIATLMQQHETERQEMDSLAGELNQLSPEELQKLLQSIE